MIKKTIAFPERPPLSIAKFANYAEGITNTVADKLNNEWGCETRPWRFLADYNPVEKFYVCKIQLFDRYRIVRDAERDIDSIKFEMTSQCDRLAVHVISRGNHGIEQTYKINEYTARYVAGFIEQELTRHPNGRPVWLLWYRQRQVP